MLNFSNLDFRFLINEEASLSHLPAVGEALCSLARISLSERAEGITKNKQIPIY